MSIDNQTVRKVSKLAKIKINEKEETKLIEELNNILGWVDELKKVDTEKIEPMLSPYFSLASPVIVINREHGSKGASFIMFFFANAMLTALYSWSKCSYYSAKDFEV